jgi:hypothetical protein
MLMFICLIIVCLSYNVYYEMIHYIHLLWIGRYINFLFVVSYKNYILTLVMISFTIMFLYNYIIMVHYINFLCNTYNIMVITIMIVHYYNFKIIISSNIRIYIYIYKREIKISPGSLTK